MKSTLMLVTLTLLLAMPLKAEAYIGPGAGMAAIGTVIAFIGAVFLAIIAFVWYPIKRMLAKVRRNGKDVR